MKKSDREAWTGFRRPELFKGLSGKGLHLVILDTQIAEVLNRYIRDPSIETIVDYGSGDGCWTEYVARKHPLKQVWGYEWNTTLIELARMRCADLKNVKFIEADISKQWHHQCDLFFAIGLLEHFSEHKKVLSHLVSTLRKDGFCILSVPNATDINYVTQRCNLSPAEVEGKDRVIGTKYGYEEYWSPRYFKEVMEEAGLTLLELWTVNRWSSPGLFCVAQKRGPSLLSRILRMR